MTIEGVDPALAELLIVSLDLGGTFAFALSGAMAGVRKRLDLFGVLLLACAASTTGGVVRDLLIGADPPAAFSDWRYFGVSLAAGLLSFGWAPIIDRLRQPVVLLDAAGLALFAVAGAQKSLASGADPILATLLGMLTAIGGGMARDLLLARIPAVLRADLYAVAALVGAGTVVAGNAIGLAPPAAAIAGGAACLSLRLLALRNGWHLPRAPG